MKPAVRAKVERLMRESPVAGERAACRAALAREDARIEAARGKPGWRDYRVVIDWRPTVIVNGRQFVSMLSFS